MAGMAIAAVVVVGGLYLVLSGPDTEPVPAPTTDPSVRPLETVAPAETAEDRGDSARDIVAELRERDDAEAYAEAYSRAEEFAADGRYADAQLLYFFAARNGYPPAAFAIATGYDPLHEDDSEGLAENPDAFQAYRWYREAQSAGNADAGERLAELKVWAENAAADGDAEAERLLLQWE